MPSEEQVRRAVETYVDSFRAGDRDRFMAVIADDAEQIDPVGSPPNRGRDAIGRFWNVVAELCERIDFEVRDLFVSGDEAALVFHIVQHRRDGSTVTVDGVDVFRVDDDGRIASVKGYPRLG